MRVAITGTTGRVGAALAAHFGVNHEVICLPRGVCDLADSVSLRRALDALECDVFLNPAAITSLEDCDDDARLAMRVNSAAAGKIALWAAERGVRMVHFSTDYVFGGQEAGFRSEVEKPEPLQVYGRSKLAGERAVLTHPGHLVLRVSWIFGPGKPSFVDSILDAALAGKPLAAVADKWSLPTCATDLAGWVESLIERGASGLLHACNPGEPVSWHSLASVVVREMTAKGLLRECPKVAVQMMEDFPLFRAARPRYTAMDSGRLAAVLGSPLRPWAEAVAEHVGRRCGK